MIRYAVIKLWPVHPEQSYERLFTESLKTGFEDIREAEAYRVKTISLNGYEPDTVQVLQYRAG